MTIMQISDLHLGKIVNNYSMLDDQRYVLEQIKMELISKEVNILLIAGDIFDRPIPSYEALELFEQLLTFITDNNIKLLAINGNHDNEHRVGYLTEFLKDNCIYISSNRKLWEKITIDNIDFYLIGYKRLDDINHLTNNTFKSEEEAKQFIISQIQVNKNKYNILIDHSYIISGNQETMIADSERQLSLGGSDGIDSTIYQQFDLVTAGHLHRHQHLKPNIYYSGSICPFSFSETNNKNGYYLHCITQEKTTDYIPFELLHKFIVIEDYIENITNYQKSEDYVSFIILNDSLVLNPLGQIRDVFPNVMQIEYKHINNQSEHIKINAREQISDKFADFYYQNMNMKIDEIQLEYFKKTYAQVGDDNDTD